MSFESQKTDTNVNVTLKVIAVFLFFVIPAQT